MIDAAYDAYRRVLQEAAGQEPSDWSFKRQPAYQQILEHVSQEQGLAYLALAMQHPRWGGSFRTTVAETALANDLYGQPRRADFDVLGISCSPTNMRYLWHALCVWDHVGALGIDAPSFVEIGGGYGGLALWMYRLAPRRRLSYAIIDVPEASTIQRRYLDLHGVTLPAGVSGSFLISAYGFSEFSPPIRDEYERNVVRHCPHGWLAWNMIPVYPFTDALLTIEDERPLTGAGNKIVTF